MALGAILGIGQLVGGIFTATAKRNAQRQKVEAANRAKLAQYKQSIKQYRRAGMDATNRYNLSKVSYQQQLLNNRAGAAEASTANLRRLTQLKKQSRLADQASNLGSTLATGRRAASGATGKTAARLQASDMAAFGRNQAIRRANLENNVQDINLAQQKVNRGLRAADLQAQSQVAFAPTFGPEPMKPIMGQMPGNAGFFGDILNAGIGAVSTASSLTASGQGINKVLGI